MKVATFVLCVYVGSFLSSLLVHLGECAPVPEPAKKDKGKKPPKDGKVKEWMDQLKDKPSKEDKLRKDIVDFMIKFGYAGAPLNSMIWREADEGVKKFQKRHKLPETGEYDETTEKKMKEPRCGLPDGPVFDPVGHTGRAKRYVTYTDYRWTQQHFTFAITDYTGDMNRIVTRSTFVTAFKAWSDRTTLTFTPILTSSCGTADFTIRFVSGCHGDGFCFDGAGSVLAHAFYPTSHSLGGDVHVDDDETWVATQTQSGTFKLLSVAIHEIGHSLGLQHSSVNGAIMNPYYSGRLALGQDDIGGIQNLYGNTATNYNPNDRPISDSCVDRSAGYPQLTVTTTTTSTTTTPTTTTTTPTTTTTTPTTTTTTPGIPSCNDPNVCCFFWWWWYC